MEQKWLWIILAAILVWLYTSSSERFIMEYDSIDNAYGADSYIAPQGAEFSSNPNYFQ